jgi:hypothetical protein
MSDLNNLNVDPRWLRVRRLVAEKLGRTENEVQAIVDKGDSLEKVELAMTLEELGED